MQFKIILLTALFTSCLNTPLQLNNFHVINQEIYSGSSPQNDLAFSQLKDLGIKTIISVDGITPNIHNAHKYGLTYVHIPVGYDGITRQEQLSLKQVLRQKKSPYYIHCHHGTQRGPTAAALLLLMQGKSQNEALQVLSTCGTDKRYKGLWASIEKFSPIQDEKLPALSETSESSLMVSAMVQIDRAFDHLKNDKNDEQILLFQEGFREALRAIEPMDKKKDFTALMKASQKLAFSDVTPENLNRLKNNCRSCHKKYRD
jgi:protein tyrosine phosphatase (PTP) superfamily phosphohydrolase (DUF442 family)